jgi:hypothetical protein
MHYGARCLVCTTDMGGRYGDYASGFIHVHHLTPLSEMGGDTAIDPVRDLRPLLVMRSAEGASRLLAKGLAKLEACPMQVQGVDIAAFRERLRACASDLASGRLTRAEIPTMGVASGARP